MPKYLLVTKRDLSAGKTFDLDYVESSLSSQVEKKRGIVISGTFKYFLTGDEAIFSIEFNKEKPETEEALKGIDMNEVVFGKRENPHRY